MEEKHKIPETIISVNSKDQLWFLVQDLQGGNDDVCFIYDKSNGDITIPFFSLVHMPGFMDFFQKVIKENPVLKGEFLAQLNKPLNRDEKSYFDEMYSKHCKNR